MAKSSIVPGQAPAHHAESTSLVPSDSHVPAIDNRDYDSPSNDRITPFLGIVSSVGKLAKKFRSDYAKFVYAERLVLGAEVKVIGLRLEKLYVGTKVNGVELKFEDKKPTWKTANAAHQAGFAIDFDSNCPNKAEEAANLLLLVSGPKDDPSGDFFIEIGGDHFAPVQMTVRRGGYRSTYKPLFTQQGNAQMRGQKLYQTVWTMSTEEVASKKNDNVWPEPRIAIKSRLTDEELKKLEEVLPNFISNGMTAGE